MDKYLKEYCKSEIRTDLLYLYFSLLYNLNDLCEKFNIDEIEGVLALYYYAYYNGYLSYNHHFKYNKEKADDILLPPKDLGFVISTGYGVCRNISFQLRDFLEIKEIKSYVVTTDSRKFSLSPTLVSILVNLLPTVFGNHVLNYIKDEETFFLYDPTNNVFPTAIDYSLLQYPNSKIEPVWIVNTINKGMITPLIKKGNIEKIQQIKERYQQQLEVLDSNKDILEKFYQDNKDIYFEMNYKLSKVKEKKLY